MIVKNESAILERCLDSVRPYIDCYYICDTGSTDGTLEIIGRVLEGLPGEVGCTTFRDFGQARNEALELARKSNFNFDYLLLIDADMELVAADSEWKDKLTAPAYSLRQVSGELSYHNVRLLARRASAKYVGATHEYLALETSPTRIEDPCMLDHACGSSRFEKTERDMRLLRTAVEQNPQDARSHFYLAQTLREAGRFEEAIEVYRRRIQLGGWEEEVWYSLFMIARCYQGLEDNPRFLAACMEAYDRRPSRAEPLHAIARHYRLGGRNEACALLCEAGLKIPRPTDLLFIQEDVYKTGFRQEMSICGYYSHHPERRARAGRFCEELATDREASDTVRNTARTNWRFYTRSASELFGVERFVRLEHPRPEGFHLCNPSVVVSDGAIWCVLRSVNYSLESGHYLCDDNVIRTQNYLCRLDHRLQPVSSVPILEERVKRLESALVVGLEDIRLISHRGRFRGSATVADRAPDHRRQMVVFDLPEDGRIQNLTVQEYGSHTHQKNWVPFVRNDELGFICYTDPITVLRFEEESRQCEPWFEHTSPAALEDQRGSSGAVPFDGGWLYVTHQVIFHDNQRTYLHRFIHVDQQFEIQAVTEPFYFRVQDVEFCCGLAEGPGEGELLVSFGVQDREAWLMVVGADEVRGRLRCVREGNRG